MAIYPDLMVDVETTSTDPVNGAILQIAAVRFNYETLEVGPTFNMSLTIPYGRFWDEETRGWWMKKLDVYNDIVERSQPADEVMTAFSQWCYDTSPALAIEQRFWAKPISFDWPFISSYCKQFGLSIPFRYRYAVDMNSFFRGLANNPGLDSLDRQLPFDGDAHNALDDCFHQIKVVFMARSLINAA